MTFLGQNKHGYAEMLETAIGKPKECKSLEFPEGLSQLKRTLGPENLESSTRERLYKRSLARIGEVISRSHSRGWELTMVPYTILTETLGMSMAAGRWIPGLLSYENKALRSSASKAFLAKYRRFVDGFFHRIVITDETWINLYGQKAN